MFLFRIKTLLKVNDTTVDGDEADIERAFRDNGKSSDDGGV